MATEIPLTQGLVAVVDDGDAGWLRQWLWSASRCHGRKFVAVRNENGRPIYMHRELAGLGPGDGLEVDHVNHDTLDNRRSNLRVVTPTANKQYQPARGGSSSYVGVTWDAPRRRWRAQIQIAGRVINLGRFATEREAAAARDAWVVANGTAHKLNLPVAS